MKSPINGQVAPKTPLSSNVIPFKTRSNTPVVRNSDIEHMLRIRAELYALGAKYSNDPAVYRNTDTAALAIGWMIDELRERQGAGGHHG